MLAAYETLRVDGRIPAIWEVVTALGGVSLRPLSSKCRCVVFAVPFMRTFNWLAASEIVRVAPLARVHLTDIKLAR